MSTSEPDRQDSEILYKVVMNHEEQYSIWPVDRDNAPGWKDEGTSGTRQACLDHIKQIWTDMRPASLRENMAALAAQGSADE
jgi:MbtH protein